MCLDMQLYAKSCIVMLTNKIENVQSDLLLRRCRWFYFLFQYLLTKTLTYSCNILTYSITYLRNNSSMCIIIKRKPDKKIMSEKLTSKFWSEKISSILPQRSQNIRLDTGVTWHISLRTPTVDSVDST